MTRKQFLHTGWTVRPTGDSLFAAPAHVRGETIPAVVPGCVHTDLMAAGLIPDPLVDFNENWLKWIGHIDWEYRTTFEASAEMLAFEQVDLVCEGLDTVAHLRLNDEALGDTENMHMAYRFPVRHLLREGANSLVIEFRSPVDYMREQEERIGTLPYVERSPDPDDPLPFNFIRKTACSTGWDWGPIVPSSGIWQPIYLQGWNAGRIDSARPLVRAITEETAQVDVLVDVTRVMGADQTVPGALTVTATLTAPDGTAHAQTALLGTGESLAEVKLSVPDPRLWWPRGYGDQPLYTLDVKLSASDGTTLDSWTDRIGLRTTRLIAEEDSIGLSFVIEINGQRVFCKGANWIPDDCFPTRIDEGRYRQRIRQATDANMNMLRVWGGGIYENEVFYRICDELGVMVWQDFLFACAMYPEEQPFWDLVDGEARYQVKRLSKHPSLVIWNGNNENLTAWENWGWKEKVVDRLWGKGFYFGLLPAILNELDPTRPYWPGSPYSGSLDINPDVDGRGNRHIWDAWFGVHYDVYRRHRARFCSEFGWQAPATWPTMAEAMGREQFVRGSAGLKHRQRSDGAITGDGRNDTHMRVVFPEPSTFDDWHYVLQINQARALTTGVEWFRSIQPECMGTVYWQINDCWPGTTWAAIDSGGRRKPLWYATRRFYAPRLLTIQPANATLPDAPEGALLLCANNDTGERWQGTACLARMSFEGEVLHSVLVEIDVEPRGNTQYTIDAPIGTPDAANQQMLVAQLGEIRALWYFDVDKNLRYPDPSFEADLERDGTRYRLTLKARSLLRDVTLYVDRIDPNAVVNDQAVTLLAGEIFTFEFNSEKEFDLTTLTSVPVLQTANRFGARN